MHSSGEAKREPPVMNWRLGGQLPGSDPRSLDGKRMHNWMKGLPCEKLNVCEQGHGHVRALFWFGQGHKAGPNLPTLFKSEVVCNLTKILRWEIYGTSRHSKLSLVRMTIL